MNIKKHQNGIRAYSSYAIPHLEGLLSRNEKILERISHQLVLDVKRGRSLFIFGSGHSGILALELYHRAGGASFVIPIIADYLLPTAGPPVVRLMERTPGASLHLLDRASPRKGEMIWIISQSGINCAAIDMAIQAKRRNLYSVAFTSLVHSQSMNSRHPSKKRLYEICNEVVDLGGVTGDAVVPIHRKINAGPLSTLSAVFLGHSILVATTARLEAAGIRCLYTSVNTAEGEVRNRVLEQCASKRDPLLR